jgi:putative phage-type endonuclease
MNREQWLEERRKGIGGSDVAGILGVSTWSSPMKVWAQKKGLIPDEEDSLRFKIGKKFEAPIAELYAEREKCQLQKVVDILHHPSAPLLGNPDRVVAGTDRGLEVKTADPFMAAHWGEEYTDEIPIYYLTQIATYLAITNFRDWDVAVLFGTSDFRIYRITRDLELENLIIDKCTEFWNRYIIGNEEPPIDASEATSKYLLHKFPKGTKELREADEDEARIISSFFDRKADLKSVTERYDLSVNLVKAAIGDLEGLSSPHGKVTWKKDRDSEKTDWKSLAQNMLMSLPPQLRKEKIQEYTKTKPGARRFNNYPAKAEKEEQG